MARASTLLTLAAAGALATAATAMAQDLTGAGSTFAKPIYDRWAAAYQAKTGVQVNYQGIGSGGGIRQFSDEIIDFGATDGPMTDEQIAAAKGGPVLHFPTVLGGVSVTYNLPEVKTPLKFTGPLLADIYLGKVTKWNDPAIKAVNPGVQLPNRDIAVAHRSDGSGTTYIFADYLSSVSKAWASGPGKGTAISWPVGLGGKGSEGVAGIVKQTPGGIGYVELAYAQENKLPSGLIRNMAGEWVAPTLESVTMAASGAVSKLPANTDYRISIVNPPGRGVYPIASFTWILVYAHPKDQAKAKKLVDFLHWAYAEGESMAGSLDYAPLPKSMITKLQQRLGAVQLAAR